MPYRRRRRKRKRVDRQMQFRLGNINPAGGRPIIPNTKTYTSVCGGQYACSGTTAGDTGALDLTNYNQPVQLITTSFTGGDTERHGTGHVQLTADGFDRAVVLSAYYRFDIRFVGTSAVDKDFVFAYKFNVSSSAAAVFTAGTTTVEVWNDMRATRGWVWKRFSGTESGGSIYPSQGTVIVKIKSVPKLVLNMNRLDQDTDVTYPGDVMQRIDDLAATDTTSLRGFLHFCVFTIDGTVLTAADIVIDITSYKKTKVSRALTQAGMIDEGDLGTG